MEFWLYYQFKSPWLSVIVDLLFKGKRKMLPEALQAYLLLKTHEGHSGRQNTKEKSCGLLHWPLLCFLCQPMENSSIGKKYKSRIMVCLKYLCFLPSRNGDTEE